MHAAGQPEPDLDGPTPDGAPRPQAILLTFFGSYLLGRDVQVATSSVIEVLDRVGVSEHATRSTLSRMARRDLLRRVRRGRQVYLGLTTRSQEILRDGETRVWHTGAVNEQWDGTWTLLGFSLPESWQRQRHELRSRLLWAGFGPLQNGLWISPSHADVAAVTEGLQAARHIRAFEARALAPTDLDGLLCDAWDLDAIAARYRGFVERWQEAGRRPPLPDRLAQHLALQTDWLQVIRQDPRLPARHLPRDWPAAHAQEVFRTFYSELDPEARTIAARILDLVPDLDAGPG
ncbi:PaaX family transcriptional regulator [Pseudonocardia humida]|uniref:PaaX family transcriptional regulator n=1 Tax=Pseudonocardia humida TaxID=2800819 RepID=UPI00207C8B8C|nr:PaaX family transcriptional regulator C-terminal domain-containing protein [Pseudonocardia humida]